MKVFIIAALSADGYIARSTTETANWTSSEDKKLFVKLTKEAGVIIMGATTLSTIGRALPGRRTIVYTSHPEDLTIPEVEPTAEDPKLLLKRLEDEGVTSVAICGGRSIYTLFMKAGLVDELYLTVEPVLFGIGIPLFSEPINVRISMVDTSKLNENVILLHYSATYD